MSNIHIPFPAEGKLNSKVYERIGKSFNFIKEREPFIFDTEPVQYAAVLNRADNVYFNRSPIGAEKMLTDAHIQTAIIDKDINNSFWNKIFIIPD